MCTCDDATSFAWSTDLLKCVCKEAFFLTNDGTCSACPAPAADASYKEDTTIDGLCTCDDATFFAWNTETKACACKASYFLDETTCA
jgi:hypothetical protein